ncbi:DUF2007 domain-containing protein [Calditrichota bacterium]
MIKVYSNPNITMVHHLKNLLMMEGIASEVRNERLSMAIGEIPPTEAWVELWIENELSYPRAMQLIEEALKEDDQTQVPWRCPNCKEENEGQFGICWNCGAAVG